MNVFTVGFTKKSAEEFFEKLRGAGVQRLIDVRLNNSSQLAGFSKRDDLRYFLNRILSIEYVEMPLLAPTHEMLDSFKKAKGSWNEYERSFVELIASREIEKRVDPTLINESCLLCSEEQPHFCHRRLVAEYLQRQWGNVSITHIV